MLLLGRLFGLTEIKRGASLWVENFWCELRVGRMTIKFYNLAHGRRRQTDPRSSLIRGHCSIHRGEMGVISSKQ
jgi:hypothetical protein